MKFAFPTDSSGARKFTHTSGGTLFAGRPNLIGFLRDTDAAPEFVSLTDRLPPALRAILDLHDVLAVGDTVYFADVDHILR